MQQLSDGSWQVPAGQGIDPSRDPLSACEMPTEDWLAGVGVDEPENFGGDFLSDLLIDPSSPQAESNEDLLVRGSLLEGRCMEMQRNQVEGGRKGGRSSVVGACATLSPPPCPDLHARRCMHAGWPL